jgi:hypothetical protein
MHGKRDHWRGDTFILESTNEGNCIEWLSHALLDYILALVGDRVLTGWIRGIVANPGPAAKRSPELNWIMVIWTLIIAGCETIFRFSCE